MDMQYAAQPGQGVPQIQGLRNAAPPSGSQYKPPEDTSDQGARQQMAAYDQYTRNALGESPEEAMQKADMAASQQAQGVSDQAVQQAIKAGRSAGAMGGQAALAATGQAAGAYGEAKKAARQEYFNTAQLGAQLGAEMSARQRAAAGNRTNQYGIQVGAETNRYSTDVGAASDRYSTDVGARTSRYSADRNAEAAAAANRTAQRGQNIGLIGSAIGAAGGLAGLFSDKRLKEDVKPASMTDGLAKIRAFTYRYKPGAAYAGGREEGGVMAQDLEKTGMRDAVVDTPDGKKVDTNRLTTMNTGALAEHERQIKNIIDYIRDMKRPEVK